MSDDPFETHLARWQEWAEQPWGRVRFAVVAHVLDRWLGDLAAQRGRPLRVLDVGGGDGRDSLPLPLALAGHQVTVVDTAPGMLAEAERRASAAGAAVTTVERSLDDLDDLHDLVGLDGHDLVLCHFVLHYRAADAGDVRRLARCAAPGGLVSLAAPNPAGRVLQRLVREGPAAALEELASDTWSTTTFAHSGRQVTSDEVEAEAVAAGLRVEGRYGGRTANDLLTDDAAKHDPTYLAQLVELEIALCDQEPFRRSGGFWQLVARA